MLKLKANPTFIADVGIPVAGSVPVKVKVEFKHRTKSAFSEWLVSEERKGLQDPDAILDVAVNWIGVEGEMTREALMEFFESYHGAAHAIMTTYIDQLTQHRLGN